MTESFEAKAEKACEELVIPGIVVAAGNRSGSYEYAKALGVNSLQDKLPMKLESTMWIASCTKLVTTIAVMQCVERGLLNLDDDVTKVLSELKDLPILKGFDEENGGVPILIPNTKAMTLRHLLTHSSGLGYDIFNPDLMRYQEHRGQGNLQKDITGDPKTLIREKYVFPLLFEPGEGWEYSVGIDWAGQTVERVTNSTLEEYIIKNILQPLDIHDMTFHPLRNQTVSDNLCTLSWRTGGVNMYGSTDNPDGKVTTTSDTFWNPKTVDNHGGAGLFSSVTSYLKIVRTLLEPTSATTPILASATITQMFTPQLSAASHKALAEIRATPERNDSYGGVDMDVECDWGLGGLLNLGDMRTGRRKGSMTWGGYPNLIWWCDRDAGVAGVLGTQICPPGDPNVLRLQEAFERGVYEGRPKL